MTNLLLPTISQDGNVNVVLTVTGILDERDVKPTLITDIKSLQGGPSSIRLDRILYSIEEKLHCLLWWEGKEKDMLILPLAGRGMFDFDWMSGRHSPKGHSGNIKLSTSKWTGLSHFTVDLEFTKQFRP